MKSIVKNSICVSIATLSLAACSNNTGLHTNFRPAYEGPRYYTAAHDAIGGDCLVEKVRSTHKEDGRFTIEDALPAHSHVVRCLSEVGP